MTNQITERDFETRPYSADERRVADWLLKRMQDMIGPGDDPIGFVLASYEMVHIERTAALNALRKIVVGHNDDGPFIAAEVLKELGYD